MRHTQYVEVEVDLDAFDEDELVEYVKEMGYRVSPKEGMLPRDVELQKVYEALKLSDTDLAIKLMSEYVCDELGRVL